MKTYSIIPHLVNINTDLSIIHDFLMSQNLDFYPKRQNNTEFEYTVKVTGSLKDMKPNYMLGNYCLSKDRVFYSRKLLWKFGFSFAYEQKEKKFIFNELYRFHQINIGDIFTMGRHIFHLIEKDLLLKKKFVILSAAVVYKNKPIILLAPYRTGKSTFVVNAIRKGASYVSENFSVVDTTSSIVYGTGPVFQNRNRQSNIDLRKVFSSKPSIIETISCNKFYIYHPKKKGVSKEQLIDNYVSTYTGFYKKNNFVRSILYFDLLNNRVEDCYRELKEYIVRRVEITDNIYELIS